MQKSFLAKSIKMPIASKFGKILLIFISSATLASAQVIISDNFDRHGDLNGSSPVVGGGTWAVGSSGNGTMTTSTAGGGEADSVDTQPGDVTVIGAIAIPTAYLTSPGGSLKNGIYTLSITMSNPGPNPNVGVLFGLGSINNPSINPWNGPNDLLGMASVNLRGSDPSDAVMFPGPGLSPYSTLPLATPGAPVNFVLTFDVSNSAPWTLSATVNGTPFSFGGNPIFTYPSNGNPTVTNDVFISEYGVTTGAFQNLVFAEQAVPEPTTWALMLAGLAFLGFCIRRKRA